MRGQNAGFKHTGGFHDPPGLFQTFRIACRIGKTVSAQIRTDGGNSETVVIRQCFERFELSGRVVQHVEIPADGINLDTFRAEFTGAPDPFLQRTAEGFHNHSDLHLSPHHVYGSAVIQRRIYILSQDSGNSRKQ